MDSNGLLDRIDNRKPEPQERATGDLTDRVRCRGKFKKSALMVLIVLSGSGEARTVIQQNFPGTKWKDLTQPEVVIDDGEIYQTFPGGMGRDLTEPNYYLDGDTIYQEALPGVRSRDYSEPSFSIKHEDDW